MKRPLALVGFSYLLALTVALFFGERLSPYLACGASILFTIFFLSKRLRKGMVLSASMLAAALAFSSFSAGSSRLACVENLHGIEAEISGVVVDLPYDENYRTCYLLEVRRIENHAFPANGRILVYAKEPIADGPGDCVEGVMRLLLPDGNTGPFGQRASLAADGVYLYAFPVEEGAISVPGRENSLWISILSWKERLYDAADAVFSRSDSAFVKALLFGDKHELSEEVQEDFRVSGVSHLLAVSGFHLAVVTQLLTLLLRALRLPRPFCVLGVAAGILLFMATAGFSFSVCRSGIMCLILLLGECCFRRADTLNSLGLAVLLICLHNPYAAADAGFLLSISATAGIALCAGRLQKAMERLHGSDGVLHRLLRPVYALLASTLGALLFTLPLSLPLFGTISPAAVPANLLMMIPSSLLLQLSLLTVLAAAVAPGAASIAAIPVSWLCRYLRSCAAFLSGLPYASFSFSGREAFLWLGCALFLLGLAVLLGRGRPKLRLTGLLCVILFLVTLVSHQFSLRNVTCCSVLSSGDGISLVLTRNGRAAVVGCGGYSESPLLRELDAQNVKELDLLALVSESFEEGSNAGHTLEKKPASILLCRRESLANATLLSGSEKAGETVCYGEGYTVSLWDGAVSVERSGDFVRILCGNERILLWPEGAGEDTLPEDWKDCTILVMEETPDSLSDFTPRYGIFCMDEDAVSRVWRADYSFLPLATEDGAIEIRVGAGNTTQVRREL